MASGKVQQDRFEKALKQLLRQQENKSCMHCCALGPTYVVPKYAIFICTQCSGVQRDFARCKSISMSKFEQEEVDLMKEKGNAWAAKTYLANWSEKYLPRPTDREKNKLEKWIKKVFEEQQFYSENGGSQDQTEFATRKLLSTQSLDESSSTKTVLLQPRRTFTSSDNVTQAFLARKTSSVTSAQLPPLQVNFDPFGDAAPSTAGGEVASSTNSTNTTNLLQFRKSSQQATHTSENNTFDPFIDFPSPTSQPQQQTQNLRAQLPEDIFLLDQIPEQPQQTQKANNYVNNVNNTAIFGQTSIAAVPINQFYGQNQVPIPAAPTSNFPVQQVFPQNQVNMQNATNVVPSVPIQQFYGQNQQNVAVVPFSQQYSQNQVQQQQPRFVPQFQPANVNGQSNYQGQQMPSLPMYRTSVPQGQINLQQQQQLQQQQYMYNMQPQYTNVSMSQQMPIPSQQMPFVKQFSMGQVGALQTSSGGLGTYPQFQSFRGYGQTTNFDNQNTSQGQQLQIQPYQLQSQMQSTDVFSDLAAGVFGKKDGKSGGQHGSFGGSGGEIEFIGVPKPTGNPFA